MGPTATSPSPPGAIVTAPPVAGLLSIGEAAARAGVSQRALRYYQEIGLIVPAACTPGGLRRYSEDNLARVARIRELQTLLGLDLDEIAVVLRSEDRMMAMRVAYHDERTGDRERQAILRQCLDLQQDLRATVESKRRAITEFLTDLDQRISHIHELLTGAGGG
jgi:DNA-binding transcriptional MerR regulator